MTLRKGRYTGNWNRKH